MNIKNARCIVTGASSGIGLETARTLAASGARVVAAARGREKLEKLFAGTSVQWIAADTGTSAGVDEVIDFAVKNLGGIDVYIANAGFAYFERSEKADWQHEQSIFSINVLSPVYAFQRIKSICGSHEFLFAATSSAMSYVGMPGYASYAATKSAVMQYFDTVRFELEPHQHVMTIHPVATKTEFFNTASSSYVPWPAQCSQTVARAVVRGIRKNKKRVFPLGLFPAVNVLFTLLPFVKTIYLKNEWKKTGLQHKKEDQK